MIAGCAWYVHPALSTSSRWRSGTLAAIGAALLLSACGGQKQDAQEPTGHFTVSVVKAAFPSSQRLSDHTHMVVAVKNTGTRTLPNVAITVTNPTAGTSDQSFGEMLTTSEVNSLGLASRSRPAWIVDRPPERLIVTDLSKAKPYCRFACQSGGAGGAVTAYSDTWAAGALQPGAIAVFDWGVTAVRPGHYVLQYRIAAGLNGKAKAVLADGSKPVGRFHVTIGKAPAQSYVNDSGGVVKTK